MHYPDYCHTRTNVGRNDGYSTVSVASDEVFTNPVFTSLPAKGHIRYKRRSLELLGERGQHRIPLPDGEIFVAGCTAIQFFFFDDSGYDDDYAGRIVPDKIQFASQPVIDVAPRKVAHHHQAEVIAAVYGVIELGT